VTGLKTPFAVLINARRGLDRMNWLCGGFQIIEPSLAGVDIRAAGVFYF